MSRINISCPRHPDAILLEDHRAGDMICPSCGLVVGDRVVDVGSEWRTFSDSNSDPSRVGAAENPLLENDLSTTIARTADSQYQNRNTLSNTNRTLLSAFRDINEIASRAALPKTVTDEAHAIFKKVHEKNKLRNRPSLAVATASLYYACRLHSATRSFREMASLSGVSTKDIGRCFALLQKILDRTTQDMNNHVDPSDFMPRFCSSLQLSAEVQRIATHIADIAKQKSITDGRNPTSIAAAAIYMAAQLSDTKKSQKEISEVAGCADSTIKQSYRLLLERADELVPRDSDFYSRINQLPAS